MSHGYSCLDWAVEKLAQTIADHAAKLAVNDNGFHVFCGHCLRYFEISVVAVINSHGGILLTLKCAFDQLAQATNSNRKKNNPSGRC